ncbi:chloride channel protein [uncultured Paraglaciecola sp.]|uniref:chloride channel protein n=1 Tax=uncultured Paraglaciecola sp. TaxID=1765024 RepID=UPI0030DA802D|tara:strand:+ start:164359 stop:166035 length:1677 start_codon:yes stop_codon:yes gene_type:complete
MNLNAFRKELATPRTSIQLCAIAIVAGVCSAALIIVFRLFIEWIQLLFLPEVNNFSALSPNTRLFVPMVGAILIVIIAYLTGFKHYRMGIPFVIHRVKHYFGHIPFRTTINQFLGGAIALASGFSVGREGPSVHLGAFGSSFIGQWLKLPDNSIRILSGCGIAAAISASFNTPFAAVLFVMEVVIREYKIHIFIPIMLAAACGSVMTRAVFGEVQELAFIQFTDFNHWIYLYLVIFGIVLGALATFFNNSLMAIIRGFHRFDMVRRLLIAGAVTSLVGFILPEALGTHFNSAHALFSENYDIQLLVWVLCAKFILTIVALGLGVPGGIIGPVFVIGMLGGVLLASPLGLFVNDVSELHGSFSLLGMAGLMAAVVHAPLAALSAVMELSYSPELVLPAILVIVPAYVTATQFLGNRSIFIRQLDYQKLPYTISSVMEYLQRTGVLAIMDTEFTMAQRDKEHLVSELAIADQKALVYKSSVDDHTEYALVSYDNGKGGDAIRMTLTPMKAVRFQATLAEVYALLSPNRAGAVYIFSNTTDDIVGIISWETLRHYLHKANY